MLCCKVSLSALALSLISGVSVVAPATAEVPFTWAEVNSVVNQVDLISATGSTQSVQPLDCLCPGTTLSTNGLSQAELRFNDGSLARVGEQAQLQFWPETRNLRLTQGTTLLFPFPNQGRTSIETPNALAGLQNNVVVVRYVPTRDLTLVMALANSDTGPVSVTVKATGQEGVLYAGHMALISDVGLQVIEFDLLEFYRTSRLVLGLNIGSAPPGESANDPIALLRPNLLRAITQQQPFANTTILDPALINRPNDTPPLFDPSQEALWPSNTADQTGTAQRSNTLPPGVVMPLPEMPPPETDQPNPIVEPIGTASSPSAPPTEPVIEPLVETVVEPTAEPVTPVPTL
jgi:hypothetical protein